MPVPGQNGKKYFQISPLEGQHRTYSLSPKPQNESRMPYPYIPTCQIKHILLKFSPLSYCLDLEKIMIGFNVEGRGQKTIAYERKFLLWQ